MFIYLSESMNQIDYEEVNKEDFEDVLMELNTLSLEDDQVRYPNTDNLTKSYLFGGRNYEVYMLRKDDLPSSGPFELLITDNDEEPIGFIRGTKSNRIISFNLIHIQDEHRGYGTGTEIYKYLLSEGFIIKSDTEITDSTFSLYMNLSDYYTPLVFDDGSAGLKK